MGLIISEILDLDNLEFTKEEIEKGAMILYGLSNLFLDYDNIKNSEMYYDTENIVSRSPKRLHSYDRVSYDIEENNEYCDSESDFLELKGAA
jgi:hypothetical protein